ncbi:MAG: hypothetical protein ACHQ4G_07240 [Opitutales bacterium]
MKTLLSTLFAVALLGVAGCTTPESRIKQNPAAFDRATPQQQQLIKAGEVAVGFSPELVRLALGDPDRVWQRTDAQGQTVTWSYVTYETSGGVILYRGWYHHWWGPTDYAFYTDFNDRRPRTHMRVTFAHDQVVSIEEQK